MSVRNFHTTLVCMRRGRVDPVWDATALGQHDVPLGPDSALDERRALKELVRYRPDRVLSSDLARTQETAADLATEVGCSHGARRDLREQRLGSWQGKPWAAVIDQDPVRSLAFLDAFTEALPPGGESWLRMRDRVVRAVYAECRRHQRKVVCWIGHAGPIRAVISSALDLDPKRAQRFRIDPFGLSILRFQGTFADLTLLNHPATGASPAHGLF